MPGIVTGMLALSLAVPAAQAQIEEIVVTAQKREESLQDVSVAITAIGGEQIRDNDIATFGEVAENTPGLVFNAFSIGQPEIAIRGLSTKEDGAAASDATIVSVDGVYIAARTAQVFDIFDLDRVEVLRGPQSTLYGKNTVAGAVNFVTAKPTEETAVRLRQTVGNYGRFDTAGLLSGQISDGWFGKFSFSRREHNGYLRNILPSWTDPNSGFTIQNPEFGERQGESNTFNWRAHLRFEPNDRLDLTLMVDGADDRNGATNREPVGALGPLHNCACASDPIAVNVALGGAGDLHTTLAETEGYMDRDVLGVALVANYQFDRATWSNTISYRDSDFDWAEDSEGLPPFAPWVDLTGASGNPGPLLTSPANRGFTFDVTNNATEKAKQFTIESRLMSPGGATFDWLTGFFYSNEDIERREGFNFPTLGGTGPNANSVYNSFQDLDGESWAVFAQGTWNASEQLALTAGLRYSHDDKTFTASNVAISGLALLIRPFTPVTASEDWSNVDWRIALDYRMTDSVLFYASAATGYKAGGYAGSPTTATSATTPFDKETVTSYEIGMKSDLLERRLRLNLALFYSDIKDLQVTRFFQPAGATFGEFLTENAGKAKSEGAEIELTWQPTDALRLGGSYTYLNAKYKDFTGLPSLEPSGTVLDPAAFNGKRLRQAPENMYNLYGEYTMELGAGRIIARVDFHHTGEFFFDPSNDPVTASWAYDLWNARIAWETSDARWRVALWAKNLGNEDYITHLFTQRGGRIAFALPGDPRTWGVTVDYSF